MFNHLGGKPSFFDGTCYNYWKIKMKMYLGSINDQLWDVTESDYVILDLDNLTNTNKANKQCTWIISQSHKDVESMMEMSGRALAKLTRLLCQCKWPRE